MQAAPWAGNCTFTKAGTYTYHSGVDPDKMKGTVVVHADATPTATPTVTATPTATPSNARIEAHDTTSPLRNWFQDAAGGADDNSVTIKVGERVTFAYPAGSTVHDVSFRTDPKPGTCVKTQGTPAETNTTPPLPDYVQGPGWEGYCQFDAPGTYTFVCDAHAEMTGKVIVESDGEPTPTPTATATPTQTPTATPTTTPVGRAGIVAHDQTTPTPKNWFQDASSSDPADNSVTVEQGLDRRLQLPGRRERAQRRVHDRAHVLRAEDRRRDLPGTAIAGVLAARGLDRRVHVRHAGRLLVRLPRPTRPR